MIGGVRAFHTASRGYATLVASKNQLFFFLKVLSIYTEMIYRNFKRVFLKTAFSKSVGTLAYQFSINRIKSTFSKIIRSFPSEIRRIFF